MSERTLHRRAREWDLLKYSIITDIELDTIVMKQLEDLPCAGEAMLMHAEVICISSKYHA